MKCKYHEMFDDECHSCAQQIRYEKVKNNNPQPFYIVLYGVSRCYGGPEEGGRYYDRREVIQTKKVWTIKQALMIIRDFQNKFPKPKYNRFSVLGGEDSEIAILASLEFITETTHRPIYE